MENASSVKEFILLGLSENQGVQKTCFVMFLLFYMIILAGNLLIVITVISSQRLNSPMYFFLCYLSFVDICYSSVTAPKMIADFLVENKTISFVGCIAQLFGVHFFGCTEIFILTVMAYDRYVAICRPLHYTTLMTRRVCGRMVIGSWVGGFLHSIVQTILTTQLPFCGPNKIDHYFCDVHPLLQLACTNTYAVGIIVVANSGMIALSCFFILVMSYIVILASLKSQTSEGRYKALSTCGSHITVVILFFGPCTFVYIRPSSNLSEDKSVAVFYTVITPMLNPLIYTLRNEEVKSAMRKLWSRKVGSKNGKVVIEILPLKIGISGPVYVVFMENKNNVTEFILHGLTQDKTVAKVCFLLFLLFYVTIILGNLLIIITIKTSEQLNSPMYFFLSYLSFVDISYSTVTVPKLIYDLLVEKTTISFVGCIAQLFAGHFFGCTEIFLLTAMAYDRCIAICKPLHYTNIVNKHVCGWLVAASWVGGFVHSMVQTLMAIQLPFCGPNEIDHYFCDVHPLLKLVCTDTYIVGVTVAANSGVISLSCFVVLVVSYAVILVSLRTRSSEGRLKALYTCTSHITVVVLFFGPCIFIYMRPSTTFSADKMVSVFYTVITPMLNPLIYTLRNAEVKNAMKKLWSRKVKRSEQ
ncbi:uncharacterized protein J5M81_006070 [Pluvialis apricaria]